MSDAILDSTLFLCVCFVKNKSVTDTVEYKQLYHYVSVSIPVLSLLNP